MFPHTSQVQSINVIWMFFNIKTCTRQGPKGAASLFTYWAWLMGKTYKSQCNFLNYWQKYSGARWHFEINSFLKIWFIRVCNDTTATSLSAVSNISRKKRWTVCFQSAASALALCLWMHVEARRDADLLGEWKWMWKLNHILNCTTEQRVYLAVTLVRQGGRGNRVWKKKACIYVC